MSKLTLIVASSLLIALVPAAIAPAQLPRIDLDNLDNVPDPTTDPPPAKANPAAGDDGDSADGWQARFWKAHWRRVASAYVEVDSEVFLVPDYDAAKPSSLGKTLSEWTSEHTTTQRVSIGSGLSRDEKYSPPREEALAVATRIPDLTPGKYGHIASAKIVKIVGPEEMIVSDIQLVDAEQVERDRESDRKTALRRSQELIDQKVNEYYEDQKEQSRRSYRSNDNDRYGDNRNVRTRDDLDRDAARYRDKLIAEQKQVVERALEQRFKERDKLVESQKKLATTQVRLLGFRTLGAREGERWNNGDRISGPQIAVLQSRGSTGVPATPRPRNDASNRTVTAVNAEVLRRGIDEDRFTQLLAERGLTQTQFAELARTIMKQNTGYAVPKIVAAIERNKPTSPAAPAAPSTRSPAPDRPSAGAPAAAGPSEPAASDPAPPRKSVDFFE